ncbi:protein of unknown function [Taphrina deformans PYCC 5710]|uniref:Protein-lysine N-methyltransferase EFM4 n=1 Tax=Taphrina deformans (strain PYCC 5710 / ATCC 11124 / CBS 356.35 / IMI 108563 / JCM 9778 / NBRC 8474) TaxID=1097556 RepID=R4XI92_TAPDE|nr:protein of unknown function [Taphrina deformans PYCC 5710]|eukprot:CCG84209.1 protein of unknown function [Taphrina deformans PYCC 5710]
MGAKIPHVQKYLNGYSAIWPSTPIVVVQSLPPDFRPFSRFASEYGPLKRLISNHGLDLTKESDGREVLMVTMSNGGCWSANAFLNTLGQSNVIYPRAIIHDSCPTVPRYRITLRAFLIAGKYRLFSRAIATVVITIYYYLSVAARTILQSDPIGDMSKALIHRIQPQRRTYIYSKEDALIEWRDVENHARAAQESGNNKVIKELFHGSAHVMHLRQDEKRYWQIVQDAWNAESQNAEVVADEPPSAEAEGKSTLDDSSLGDSTTTLATFADQSILSEKPVENEPGVSEETAAAKEFEARESSDEEVTSDAEDTGDLNPSVLGTKEYWENIYRRECANYAENQEDEGEIWFGEESEDKIIKYLTAPSSPYSADRDTAVLDLGTGNGHLLFTLHEAGFTRWRMTGIDYSEASIALATAILRTKRYPNIAFRVQDFLAPAPEAAVSEVYNLVLDKGTFDAISLSDGETDEGVKLSQSYARSVVRLMKKDAKLIVTSCNWTREELIRRLTVDGALKVHAFFKTPKQAFQFGGRKGYSTSQVVFTKV